MNDNPKQPLTTADLLNGAHQRLEDMFKKHFWGATRLALLGMLLFIATYGVIVFAFREPANTALVVEIEKSNEELARLTKAALDTVASSNAATAAEALTAVVAQTEAHRKAVNELQAREREIPKEATTFLQLLGGSVILALLGYLGLQRLQSIDVEMQGLREFMFKQISERASEQKFVMESQIRGEVAKQFSETKAELDEIRQKSETLRKEDERRFSTQAEEAMRQITEVQEQVSEILDRYAWLEDASLKTAAEDLSHIVSVEQAEASAKLFRANSNVTMARLALRQIVEHKLSGDANEFHNAHTEAFRLKDPQLALSISELGLASFTDQYDLMADKARALVSAGQRDKAKELLEDWMDRKPEEFSRSWRPFSFYADILSTCELTEDALIRLKGAFSRVTAQLPTEDRPWAKYARFLAGIGQVDQAEKIANRGLQNNPFSQELFVALSEVYMKQGRAGEAVEALKGALSIDYQDQFQHSVNQGAIFCLLAQAHEAARQPEQAERLYQISIQVSDSETVKEYSKNRVIAIRVRKGEEDSDDGGQEAVTSSTQSQPATEQKPAEG